MPSDVLDLVVRYRKGQTYGVHTLIAALETEPPSVPYALHLARTPDEIAELAALPAGDRVVHLAGGVHATAERLVTLRAGWDAVAIGEGERTFPRFAEAVATGGTWRGLPGTAHLDDAGRPVKGPRAERLPLDHFRSFPSGRKLTSPIEITRGCVYSCQ